MRIFIIFLLLIPAFAKAPAGKQDKGDKAPDLTLKNQEGKEVKLADLKEKKNVLLAFYPKDATPG